ncbi:pilus assembly protein TadG-related protein [Brevundimonas olei]|uniref:pilus assembly protein TadG-related protein n=1 Tax=Brevundimonas olei TaxID=657642 RepID=UPI0031DCDEC3
MLWTTADPSVRARAAGVGDTMDRLTRARAAAGLKRLTARFLRQTQGNVAMMFALALPVLLMITLGAIDIHQASKVKAQLQDALDAAALAAARSTFTDDVNINKVGLAALKANMPGYFGETSGDTANFVLLNNRVTGDARVNVKVLVANIVLPPYGKLLDDYLPVSTRSEVLRASRNVEVAMVLDTTGSMSGSIGDLREAAKELVKIVVQDQQSPFYSRAAVAPYDWAVKLDASATLPGTLAKAARGDLRGPTDINAVGYLERALDITSVSRARPAVVTVSNHGLQSGQGVLITGVNNTTDLNDNTYKITRIDQNRFSLDGSDTRSASRAATRGTAQPCIVGDCSLVVTSTRHGLSDDEYVYIEGVSGLGRRTSSVPNVNGNHVQVKVLDADRFSLAGLYGPSYRDYGSGGQAYCASRGCHYFVFRNASNTYSRLPATNCVSERTGEDAYKDTAPGVAPVGRVYATNCNSEPILPLTSVRGDLEDRINSLGAAGNTAGQIGIAWGWYLVSPTFGSIFTGDGQPAPYDTSKTLKAVVLMTDGEFNAPYCEDVAANTGGRSTSRIYCAATNGDPFQQSVKLCEGMKAQNIVVYTVGFNLGNGTGKANVVDTALDVMRACATNEDTHFFKADSGTDLRDAFRAIGRDITRLRIAR